ncbi:MAG: glycoside hydrolase, partial [Eubacterium sp.]|nr:glycoside hydrolase [Eubacterium sp.]
MRRDFEKQLIDSGYIHGILLPDESKTAEARLLKKEILHSKSLWDKITGNDWCEAGTGKAEFTGDVLRMSVPARTGRWPEGAPEDGDYTFFGQKEVILKFDKENWETYNRIFFRVKPECPGLHSPMITVNLANDGVQKVPDKHMREGQHIINLKNRIWNSCIWEFPELPRDSVTELKFSIQCFGKEVSTADIMEYDISDIRLDKIADPDVSTGWVCKNNTISYSTTGYWVSGKKTAVASVDAGEFQLIEEKTSEVVFSARIKKITNDKGGFSILDFSEFKQPGRYSLRAGEAITGSFEIGHRIMEEAVWKVIHFLYSERCGYPVVGRHGTCHGDIIAEHNGVKVVYNGGWHDAGDVSQQTAQTAEVVHALLEMAETVKDNAGSEKDRLLYLRLLEEAQWGLDFVLRMRFGDGYRVSSAGVCRWTNGLIGDMDDVAARVHNHAFENFLMSGIEAYGAIVIRDMDPELAWKCLDSAKNDFRFAIERFESAGMEQASMYEHTYNSSLSQYYATASWAASVIYKATKDGYYAKEAEKFADSMLVCQETGTGGIPLKGFFYRDETKKTIVHFNHQSREQIYIQALELLCRTQKDSVKHPQWEKAMKLYCGYIKDIMKYTEPYGMIPAGIHS